MRIVNSKQPERVYKSRESSPSRTRAIKDSIASLVATRAGLARAAGQVVMRGHLTAEPVPRGAISQAARFVLALNVRRA